MFYGNSSAINSLKTSLARPNGYLLKGPKGTGKFTVALEFSKAILQSKVNIENNPDFFLIQAEGTIKKEDVLFMKRECSILPNKSKYKVYLIDDADTATVEAQNSILKVLEDSSEFNIFILICHTHMLSTIESRLSPVNFSSINPIAYREILDTIYGSTVEEFKKDILAAATQGCIGRAFNMIESINDFSNTFTLFLKNSKNKLEVMKAFGLLSEKTGFYNTYSSYSIEIINILRTIFLDILKAKNNLIDVMELSSCQEYIQSIAAIYSYDDIEKILEQINKDENLIMAKKYDKNAFFETITCL